MIDMTDRPEREPFPCMRCQEPIPDAEPQRYVYCGQACQDSDVPTEPGRGGVRS